MDVQNKDFYKTLEVIWSRNRNICRSKLLPEMKGINIDDSVKKNRKASGLSKFAQTIQMNENGVDLAHKRAKKRLFPENKSEKVSKYSSAIKLNKKHSETHSDDLAEMSQIIPKRSPPIISNRKKFKRKKFKQRLFQIKNTKTAEFSPPYSISDTSVIKSSCIVNQILPGISNFSHNKSPEIVSNRKRQYIEDTSLEKMKNESIFSDSNKLNKKHCETYSHNLTGISQNSLIKSPPILSNQEKFKKKKFKQRLFQTENPKTTKTAEYSPPHSINDTYFIKSSCIVNQILPGISNFSHNKSPEIVSNRKRQYIEDKSLEKMKNESIFSDSNKLNKKHCETYSHNLTGISQNSLIKSPPILSNQEKFKKKKFKQRLFQTENPKTTKTAEYSPPHSINDTSFIKSSCIVNQILPSTPNLLHTKSPEIMSNRKQQYIKHTFLEKMNSHESTLFNSSKLNRNHCETHSHNLTEISQNALTKSPKTTECSQLLSVNDSPIIKSSCIVNQIHSSTSNLLYKSPEIMSNRKRQNKLLKKINFSNNTPTMNQSCIPRPSKMFNEKSEQLNTHRSKVKLKLNFEDTDDIIESSEVINLASKKECKEKKNSRSKKKKIKNNIYRSENELKSVTENSFIDEKMIKNKLCDDIYDSLDIINTENILMPGFEVKVEKKSPRRKLKNFIEMFKVDKKTFKPQKKKDNEDKSISVTHLPSVSLIPATPEHNAVFVDELAVEYSSETIVNSYIPQIEVDKSPKTPLAEHCNVLIQSSFTPPNVDSSKCPVVFESVVSPTQSFMNSELSFKIDSVESPNTVHECDNYFSPEMSKKKLDIGSSPNRFDSAKKRKKICKDGLRGKFRELINRKKSEACIREYEKNLSKNCQPKHGETTLLNVIEVWKEFKTFVLLCYNMKSETQFQKVIVTLDNCPKNATKNSVIRIYSPWLTIESKTTEIMLFVGVIYAEVIEFSGYNKPLGPTGQFTNISGLSTSIFQSEVKWKCNCSEETACQCLGESSVYNYLQYMISH